MRRVPLLAGTRVVVATAGDGDLVLVPPAPAATRLDVDAAVRDALRFPLSGPPLEAAAVRGGRATIVVEPPALPLPGATRDPRQLALAAVVDELERVGMPPRSQTILVAGGLGRRLGGRELETLVTPELARRFDGDVRVHDAAGDLAPLFAGEGGPRIDPALLETDVVVCVTAAESVLHGGPAALLAAADAATVRAASGAASLLEPGLAPAWETAVGIERALARRAPTLGVSLALGLPRLPGALHGYPYEQRSVDRLARSRRRRLYGLLPAMARARVLQALGADVGVSAVFAGPPSVAHAEALLQGLEERATGLDEPVDALVVGVPHAAPRSPRERTSALVAAWVGLGFALRLWRDAFPVRDGGTLVLAHPLRRRFSHPGQLPYRSFFALVDDARDPDAIAAAEAAAADDRRALDAYRAGRACHPLQPFADWADCRPALDRLGTVVVAGCRDAVAARRLGLVPARSVGAALHMAHGRAGGAARVGYLAAPPWFPLRVGGG